MERDVARLEPRCDEFAPGAVRQALSEVPDLGWLLGDAMLVATELVSNAVRHSLCSEADRLTVALHRDEARLRISVLDPGVSGATACIPEQPGVWGGLGLFVVDQLSDRWGSAHRREGYEVWAEFTVPDGAPAATSAGRLD